MVSHGEGVAVAWLSCSVRVRRIFHLVVGMLMINRVRPLSGRLVQVHSSVTGQGRANTGGIAADPIVRPDTVHVLIIVNQWLVLILKV